MKLFETSWWFHNNLCINESRLPGTIAFNAEGQACTIKRSHISLHSWWTTRKKEPDKIGSYPGGRLKPQKSPFMMNNKKKVSDKAGSYPGGQGKNTKKNEINHI